MSTAAAPAPASSTKGPAGAGRMTLVEHLTELRSRLMKCVLAVAVGAVVGFIAYPLIFDILLRPYGQIANAQNSFTDGRLLQTDPLEGLSIRMKIAAYSGIALAMPVLLWQFWRFISPGLYDHERRYAIPFVASSMALFVTGAGLAYYTLPRALDFLITIGGDDLVTAFAPGKYFQLIVYMMLAFGIGFQFPILLIFLQMAGIVSPQALAGFRRYAMVGIVALVAVITPSGDPVSLLMLSVPMAIFYEVAIFVGRFWWRRKALAV